jgi:hypothetical protein
VSDVFVSYSRRDGEFVSTLVAELESRGKSVWLDTEGIEDGAVFPDAIRTAIEGSDAFVFVITPASAASQFCEQEVEHALALNKRIVPLLREMVADEALPEAIRVRSWIPYTPGGDQEAASKRLVDALDTDVEHARAHTHWLVRALDWDSQGARDRSFLLRGSELSAAEAWLAGVGEGAEPAPTTMQREYIFASRAASSRRQRSVVVASLVAVVGALALAGLALISRGQAQAARSRAVFAQTQAQSHALAAESEAQLPIDPERSILLAMAAVRVKPTADAVFALRRAIDLSPIRARLPDIGLQPNYLWGPAIAYSPNGKLLAEGSQNGTVLILDARSARVERRIAIGGESPLVAFNRGGSLLAVGTGSGILLVDPATGNVRARLKTDRKSVV